jgi:hypothetical protein
LIIIYGEKTGSRYMIQGKQGVRSNRERRVSLESELKDWGQTYPLFALKIFHALQRSDAMSDA